MADTEYEFSEYPKAVYRDRQAPEPVTGAWVEPSKFDCKEVQNEDEELAALEDGWRLTAEKPSAPKKAPEKVPA